MDLRHGILLTDLEGHPVRRCAFTGMPLPGTFDARIQAVDLAGIPSRGWLVGRPGPEAGSSSRHPRERLVVFSANTGRLLDEDPWPVRPATDLAFEPDGRHLSVVTRDGYLLRIGIDRRAVTKHRLKLRPSQAWFTEGGRRLVVHHESSISWLDPQDTERPPLGSVDLAGRQLLGAAPDGLAVLTQALTQGGAASSISLGTSQATTVSLPDRTQAAALLPSGEGILVLDYRYGLSVHDPEGRPVAGRAWSKTGISRQDLSERPEPIAFHSGSPRYAAIPSERSRGVTVLDLDQPAFRLHLPVVRGIARSVAWMPGRPWLLIGDSDGTASLVEIPTGRVLQEIRTQQGVVVAITGSPDGKLLATGGADTTIAVWKVDPSTTGIPNVVAGRRLEPPKDDGPEALLAEGDRYLIGDGVPKDEAKAVECYGRAAAAGSTEAYDLFSNRVLRMLRAKKLGTPAGATTPGP